MIEAEACDCAAIATKEEHDKEIERDKHKKSIETLTLDYNQVLKELSNPRTFLDTLSFDEVVEEWDRKH